MWPVCFIFIYSYCSVTLIVWISLLQVWYRLGHLSNRCSLGSTSSGALLLLLWVSCHVLQMPASYFFLTKSNNDQSSTLRTTLEKKNLRTWRRVLHHCANAAHFWYTPFATEWKWQEGLLRLTEPWPRRMVCQNGGWFKRWTTLATRSNRSIFSLACIKRCVGTGVKHKLVILGHETLKWIS